MAKKQPLYPHRTPSQMAKEQLVEQRAKPVSNIVRITQDVRGRDEYGPPYLPKETTASYHEIYARIGDKGFVNYLCFPSAKAGYIEFVSVKDQYQGQGLGRQLLQFALDDMRGRGVTRVGTSIISEQGAKLFKAFGFTLTKPEPPDEQKLYDAVKNI